MFVRKKTTKEEEKRRKRNFWMTPWTSPAICWTRWLEEQSSNSIKKEGEANVDNEEEPMEDETAIYRWGAAKLEHERLFQSLSQSAAATTTMRFRRPHPSFARGQLHIMPSNRLDCAIRRGTVKATQYFIKTENIKKEDSPNVAAIVPGRLWLIPPSYQSGSTIAVPAGNTSSRTVQKHQILVRPQQ